MLPGLAGRMERVLAHHLPDDALHTALGEEEEAGEGRDHVRIVAELGFQGVIRVGNASVPLLDKMLVSGHFVMV